ncbi:outer membrane protein transport protein [Photobacterium alginatilyticum]|uniref:Long-chain fatty acid transporter n=1 Tax=Photobacterium alginatilyticum TaxID=1775171 RepID=A0ABW9YDY2_9GAMM|nr:outer membrane protein transport protein [Photobacterium alginatilyticum]NBI51486.1 long-chain fatty acid transporter [Photobacterium alginatilyticum]
MSRKITLTAVAVTAALISVNVNAAGFQVNEHSASGLGRAFSGEAAVADNASVLARNPAAMTLFKTAEFSGAISIVDPDIDVEDNDFGQTAKDVAPLGIVPAGYYIHPINDRFAVGLALFSNYGVATEYPADFNAGSSAGETSLITLNFNPNIAYRINEHFSIGAGVSLVYGDAELTRFLGSMATAVDGGKPSDQSIKMEGDTTGWGWNVGALYEINDDHRFGLSYRSQVDLDFDGDFTDYLGVITGTPNNTVPGSLSVVLPAIAEFSGYHALNSQWAVHYGIQWIQYSKFEELRGTGDQCTPGYNGQAGVCLLKDEDYDDNSRYSIGATYILNPTWTLRAGFAFDEQAGKSTLSIPDTDRYWYSAGATYTYSPKMTFDVGLTYLDGKEATFTEDGSSFTSTGGAIISAAQINYKF